MLTDRLGARDDLQDLSRNRRLTHFVHRERKLFDELGGILARVVHGGHARSVLGRGGP